jgi:hypothetical protein
MKKLYEMGNGHVQIVRGPSEVIASYTIPSDPTTVSSVTSSHTVPIC